MIMKNLTQAEATPEIIADSASKATSEPSGATTELQPVLVEDADVLKYFQNNFGLQKETTSDSILDDQNLRQLLRSFYLVIENQMTLDEIKLRKTKFFEKSSTELNMVTQVSNDIEPSLIQVPERSYLDPNVIENIPKILKEIEIEYKESIGEDCLKLLNYLACLANQGINLNVCFHMFYNVEFHLFRVNKVMDFKSDFEDDVAVEPVDEKQDKVDRLKLLLATLEEFKLLTRVDLTDIDTDFEENYSRQAITSTPTEDSLDLIPGFAIKLNPVAYKYLRYTGRTFDQNKRWSQSLLNLSHLLRATRKPEYEKHIISLHKGLEAISWPDQSFTFSLNFITALTTWFNSHNTAQHMLRSVYNHLIGTIQKDTLELEGDGSEEMEAQLILCKMALVHLENVQREDDNVMQGKWEEGKVYDEEMLDYSDIFEDGDILRRICRQGFFDWILTQAMTYEGDELIQHFAAQLLMVPLVVHEHCLDDVRHARVINWIRRYCRNYVHEGLKNPSHTRVFSLLETPLTVMKIAMQVLPGIQVIEMAVEITRASSSHFNDGVDERSWFLQEVLYLMKPSVICVWEQEDLSDAKLFEMREICQVYIEQGQDYFTAMLTQLEKTFSRDSYLDLHFLDFLETMKASAFFDECVRILLNASEMIDELRRIFNKIVASIESGDNPTNIKAVCQIVVFWCTLICDFDKIHGATPSVFRLVEDMETFYEKLSQEDSRLAKAFHAEKHWHSYFREQGETSEKILEYFASHEEDSLMEMSHIYKLVEKLKDTTRKDWWMSSVNYITAAARVFGGSEKRQFKNIQEFHADSGSNSSFQSDMDEEYKSDQWELKLCTQIPKPYLKP